MYSMGGDIGFDLSNWIDSKNGEYNKYTVDDLCEDLHSCVEDIIRRTHKVDMNLVIFDNDFCSNGLSIELSEDVEYITISRTSIKRARQFYKGLEKTKQDERSEKLDRLLSRIEEEERRCNSDLELTTDDTLPGNGRKRKPQKIRIPLLGKFVPQKESYAWGKIVLYPGVMAKSERAKTSSFHAVFWTTFAHEIFHAYHYYAFLQKRKKENWDDGGYSSKSKETVKESLAASFEKKFIDYFKYDPNFNMSGIDALGRELEQEWLIYDVDDWPYSGALGIADYNPELYSELIEYSLDGWELPYELIKANYYTERIRCLWV